MSQEFGSNVLDLVKQKGFYPYEHMRDFEKFKGELRSKGKFCSSSTGSYEDPDMYIFFEKVTIDGIFYIFNSCSEANNKYLKSYDLKQQSKHIIFSDANNLHGYAMSKFLPASGFKWIDPKEFDLNEYTCNTLKECVLGVDLKYSKEMQWLHNDYPLSSDEVEIRRKKLPEYKLRIADLYNIPIGKVKN